MGKGKKLRLLVDSYDQPQEGHTRADPNLRALSRGDIFEARSDAEYDRLVEIGAALDPEEDLRRRRDAAEAQAQRLRDEADRLSEEAERQASAVDGESGDLSSLTKPELQARAKAAGLSGYSDLTKPELVERLQAEGGEEPPPPPPEEQTPEEAAAAAVGTEPEPDAGESE
jgi:hypothetical protein